MEKLTEVEKQLVQQYENSMDFFEKKVIDDVHGQKYSLECQLGWDIEDITKVDPEILEARKEYLIKALAPLVNKRVRAGIFDDGISQLKKITIKKMEG